MFNNDKTIWKYMLYFSSYRCVVGRIILKNTTKFDLYHMLNYVVFCVSNKSDIVEKSQIKYYYRRKST